MPNLNYKNCAICHLSGVECFEEDYEEVGTLKCPRCGHYKVRFHYLDSDRCKEWAVISHAVRSQQTGKHPYQITKEWLESLRVEKLPNPQVRANKLIEYLGDNSISPGRLVNCHYITLQAIIGTADDPTINDHTELFYVISRLLALQIIEKGRGLNSEELMLTFAGWEEYEKLKKGEIDTRTAFMAMGFSEPDCQLAFQKFIPAIKQTGFNLLRLDSKPKAGLIDLRMRVEIRSAKFLVADLTCGNQGAYWEAGYAEGLAKKVYYTCEKVRFDKMKTHFDTNHLLTILWDKEDFSNAQETLKSAIRNDFPLDAIQLDI